MTIMTTTSNEVHAEPAKQTLEQKELFGSFFLEKTELAVSINYIQEVVNFPTNITTMPLAPDYLIGVFNLRGTIVPVINLKKLMKFEQTDPTSAQKVAILDYGGMHVGFVFDSTGEILRPKPSEKSTFQYKEDSKFKIIKGALKLSDGTRLLQILDPEALVSIQNIPQLQEHKKSHTEERIQKNFRRANRMNCITFSVSGARLAFEITGIHEIVNVPEIQHSAMESDLCLGMINLRGQVIPILNFPYILKQDPPKTKAEEKQDTSNRRIIILRVEKEFFGLLVDSVESINTYTAEGIMPIPLLTTDRMNMFQGCISIGEKGDVILLNQQGILSNDEILQVTHGHAKIYQANDTENKDRLKASAHKQVYISFQLNHLFGVPIREVKEIINYSNEVLDAPGMPSFVKGVLNLRGKLVTIVDTRALYNLHGGEKENTSESKIIVFQKNEDQFGLIVDSVESIVSVTEQDKLQLPDFFKRGADEALQKDVKEVIDIPGPNGKNLSLFILNVEPVIQRLKSGVSTPAKKR